MTQTATMRARELPQTDPATARANLTAEFVALIDLVDGLAPDDWTRPTECTGWTVRHMVAHIAGSAECAVRKSTLLRVYASAGWNSRKAPDTFIDHMCAAQIAARADMTDREVAADLKRWARDAPARLAAAPGFIRRLRVPAASGAPKGATLSWFLDVINTRDVWMHRVDLARALGVARETTVAEPEAVRQVIRDLDTDWSGPPLALTLTGVGGGTWRIGAGDPVAHVTEDAVAFLRLLSGRSDECPLATDGDPSAADSLRAARVLF
ncbi:maleylpyruvate isomerase family mycothiol-dependent enzyme [Granulicoccus sp. GXG6511]|uniref:maleylpyruvate isomerase family mycothiol-dependent enzyme n=1 Tax=Granulicoccus sp. GXG6511 TaxID=3381351 RepID=UPI003D7E12D3